MRDTSGGWSKSLRGQYRFHGEKPSQEEALHGEKLSQVSEWPSRPSPLLERRTRNRGIPRRHRELAQSRVSRRMRWNL
jgi:hypothetical protein